MEICLQAMMEKEKDLKKSAPSQKTSSRVILQQSSPGNKEDTKGK